MLNGDVEFSLDFSFTVGTNDVDGPRSLYKVGDEDLQSTKDANIIINGENGLIIQFGIYPEPMTYADYYGRNRKGSIYFY